MALGAALGRPDQLSASLVGGIVLVAIFVSGNSDPLSGSTLARAGLFSLATILAGLGGLLGPASILLGLVGLLTVLLPGLGTVIGKRASRSVASPIVHYCLQSTGRFPLRMGHFVNYCVDARLLKRSHRELEFVHRRLRDFFAIREALPRLSADDSQQRQAVVKELLRLRDASCDVLLELIDDSDKNVRLLCVEGLGQIGSATAAQTLLRVIRTSGKGIKGPAIKALGKIQDVGALPLLLRMLESGKTENPLRPSVIQALARMDRLDVISNTDDLVDCLSSNSIMVQTAAVRALILQRAFDEPKLDDWLSFELSILNGTQRAIVKCALDELNIEEAVALWLNLDPKKYPASSTSFNIFLDILIRIFRKKDIARELLRVAGEPDCHKRSLAVQFLKVLKYKRAASDLVLLLEDEDSLFVETVVDTIVQLGAQNLLPEQHRPPAKNKNKLFITARELLKSTRTSWQRSREIRRVRKMTTEALESCDINVQIDAIETAIQVAEKHGFISTRNSVLAPRLVKFLRAESPKIRNIITDLFVAERDQHYELDQKTMLALIRVATDTDSKKRAAAEAIIEGLGQEHVPGLPIIQLFLQQSISFKQKFDQRLASISAEELFTALFEALLAEDSASRAATLHLMQRKSWTNRDESIWRSVLQVVEDPDSAVRASALDLLIENGIPVPPGTILRAIDSRNPAEQLAAIAAAGQFGIKQAREKLLGLLRAIDDEERWAATVKALLALKENDALARILIDLMAREPEARSVAGNHLANLGGQMTIEELLEMTRSDDPDLRGHAARCLGKIGHGQASEHLFELLTDQSQTDSEERVCDIAAEALDEIGTPSVKRKLEEWRAGTQNRPSSRQ